MKFKKIDEKTFYSEELTWDAVELEFKALYVVKQAPSGTFYFLKYTKVEGKGYKAYTNGEVKAPTAHALKLYLTRKFNDKPMTQDELVKYGIYYA